MGALDDMNDSDRREVVRVMQQECEGLVGHLLHETQDAAAAEAAAVQARDRVSAARRRVEQLVASMRRLGIALPETARAIHARYGIVPGLD